ILSIALVNALMFAPDRQPRLVAQLTTIHRRVREYTSAAFRGKPGDSTTFLALLRDIVTLRPEIANVALESSIGLVISAAVRTVVVGLVAELQAARVVNKARAHGHEVESEASARSELLHRNEEVRQDRLALRSVRWPSRLWRAPLYHSYRIAAESGVRAA